MLKTLKFSLIIAVVLSVFVFASLSKSQSKTTYSVYCANGKIEVDMRDFEQMKNARGSDICKLGEFNYLSDAQSFAKKNFGGIGTACSCK